MPGGGIFGSGSGLRLQASYPGNQDTGNGNISGVLRAGRMTTTDPGNDANTNTGENFGHANSYTNGASELNRVFMSGMGCTVSLNVTQGTVFGFNSGIAGQNNVALGLNSIAGNTTSAPSNCVAIGANCNANGTTGDGGGGPVAMGSSARARNASVAIGKTVTATHDNFADSDSVVMGSACSSVNAGVGANLVLGRGAATTKTNALIVGWYNADQPADLDNSITIGKPSQTRVRIGNVDLTGGFGTVARSVNDANAVATINDGVLQYTAITAARTVTLPAANSVPAGWRLTIADFSGNCSAVRTITAIPAGADTIIFGNALNNPFDTHEFMSDGVSKWLQTLDTR